MSPISINDWLEAGLITLGTAGIRELTIDKLAESLGVTKGSFYHHFENYQDYQERLLAYWEERYLLSILETSESAQDPVSILDMILEGLLGRPADPEISIRAWALQDEAVRAHVRRVDQARVSYLQELFHELTGDEKQALLMSQLLFTILVGSYSILPQLDLDVVQQLYVEFKRLYGIE